SALPLLGPLAENAFAFARVRASDAVVVVVPRLIAKVRRYDGAIPWGETSIELPGTLLGRVWVNTLTRGELMDRSGRLALEDLFSGFPVACLSSHKSSQR